MKIIIMAVLIEALCSPTAIIEQATKSLARREAAEMRRREAVFSKVVNENKAAHRRPRLTSISALDPIISGDSRTAHR